MLSLATVGISVTGLEESIDVPLMIPTTLYLEVPLIGANHLRGVGKNKLPSDGHNYPPLQGKCWSVASVCAVNV